MTTRFLFGPRGLLVEGPPPVPPRREEPVAVEAVDVRDERTTEELFAAVQEALKDGGRATEAERGGIFYGARNIAPDGSFDYDEHHYMQKCRCRVIDPLIVQWCPAHDAYYRRVCSGGNYRPADYEQRRARWAGVVER